jgi:hypothetical protein
MPWMPEVFTAPLAQARRVEARREEVAASVNDAVAYYEGIMANEPEALVRSFAAWQPVLDDPRVGYVEGARRLRAFVNGTADWLRERDAVVENVALTRTPTRTVEEIVLHLLSDDGGRVELPVAIVADRNPDRTLKAIRVYHSMWPLSGEHAVRSPLLPADPALQLPGGVISDYQKALAEGDLAGIVKTFDEYGYAREPSDSEYLYRGADELRGFYAALFGRSSGILQRGPEPIRSLYETLFSDGGGIPLEHCTLTDDGVRCAIEYNVVRWGEDEVPPQAGVAVYERSSSGLLAAARIYDDVEPPAVSDTSAG